ncbi:LysR substrate-binding domain-containing protein [Derxia gummosa]|uniref:LysR substrate-binding domain-containing protein n=1 Tax=Derxia gummosa DSM 723 TaxID=1121388 RepID=A0A8B6X8Z4_9BURK|nr:LysR substrate-binding domain-containing protein [Derxia gummosa]
MTLTELKYIVAVARERHFGRAAEACFVSQPTLSVAVKKLEDELNVLIFERGNNEVTLTAVGERIVEQARQVLDQTATIKEIARQGRDPLAGPLRLGMIYTIAPYLLPALVRRIIETVPQMPLLLQENFTVRLIEQLKQNEIDAAIMALPLPDTSLATESLYDEPFIVALPREHAWSHRKTVTAAELKNETMLMLGAGHCFRDQVIGICPESTHLNSGGDGIQRSFEGSSLETIRHMVASGLGITVLPQTSLALNGQDPLIRYVPFEAPVPDRRVVIAWRKSFTRPQAIQAVSEAVRGVIRDGLLQGVTPVEKVEKAA